MVTNPISAKRSVSILLWTISPKLYNVPPCAILLCFANGFFHSKTASRLLIDFNFKHSDRFAAFFY